MDEIGAMIPELKESDTWKELRKKYFEDFRLKELQMNSVMGEWNGLEVMKNVFWYIIPPSFAKRDDREYPIPESPVPYQVEFPWPKEKEVEVKDVKET